MYRIKFSGLFSRTALAVGLGLALVSAQPVVFNNSPVLAQGPASVADLAEGLMSSVVNISTAQKVKNRGRNNIPIPRVPDGSPFQDFFNDLFPQVQNP